MPAADANERVPLERNRAAQVQRHMTAFHLRSALGATRTGFGGFPKGDGLRHFRIAPRLPMPPPRPRADRWRAPCPDSQRSYSSGPTYVLLGAAKLLFPAADAKALRRDFGQVFQWVSIRFSCKSPTRSCSGANGQPAESPSSSAWRRTAAPCRPASSARPSRGSRAAARKRRPTRSRMPWRRPPPHRW